MQYLSTICVHDVYGQRTHEERKSICHVRHLRLLKSIIKKEEDFTHHWHTRSVRAVIFLVTKKKKNKINIGHQVGIFIVIVPVIDVKCIFNDFSKYGNGMTW